MRSMLESPSKTTRQRKCKRRRKPGVGLCCLLSSVQLAGNSVDVASAAVECNVDSDCQGFLHPASDCVNGFCSNPYQKGGCLAQNLPDWKKIRVCTSEDPPDAAERGYCRRANPAYVEIRIASQNWESVFFEAWILQILLTEFLDVPATVESGAYEANVNFYNGQMRMDYGVSNDWEILKRATIFEDCRLLERSSELYESCAHVIPEVWNGQLEEVGELEKAGYVEPIQSLGALGQQSWFMPRFTGINDPSLLTYLGLWGEENRHKLAETFLRPTTWQQYCDEVSATQCQEADETAVRAPTDTTEGSNYYLEGFYYGHFRTTDAGNCTLNPKTCTGHLVDFPCGWSSYAIAQTHHLHIALDTPRYSYGDIIDIWTAANHTKSNVIGQWWTPEALYQKYLGTEFELLRISLPPPTQDCIEARITPTERCSEDFLTSVGEPMGACDEAPHALHKIISKALFRITKDASIPEAIRSPAYDAISAFAISDLQLGKIFDFWLDVKKDKWGYDPREAVCDWVVNNIDLLQGFVPRTHPRVFRDEEEGAWQTLEIIALIVALLVCVLVAGCTVATHVQRNRRVLKMAQIEFLWLLLFGLLLVTTAAVLMAMPPSDASCVAQVWLFNVGYTIELVPLIVKIAAINRLMTAAQQMRRVVLRRRTLFGLASCLSLLVVIYLVVWTVKDPPQKGTEYLLTDDTTSSGETIVMVNHFCVSGSDSWRLMSVSWHGLLLITATVLAFQTRNLQHDINETQTLAILIYSHFFFVLLRIATFFLESAITSSSAALIRSLLLSLDMSATVCIYFLPKFLAPDEIQGTNTMMRRVTGLYPNQSMRTQFNGREPSIGAIFNSSFPTQLDTTAGLVLFESDAPTEAKATENSQFDESTRSNNQETIVFSQQDPPKVVQDATPDSSTGISTEST